MSFINEELALCVQLPLNVCPTSSRDWPHYMAIVEHAGHPATVLGDGLGFVPRYEMIRRICSTRAVLTVDGRLRVQGQRIKPEAYLQRWRAIVDRAVPIEDLPSQGLRTVAVIEWAHSGALETAGPHWTHPPYPTFGALLQAHAKHIQVFQRGALAVSRLEIDLTEPDGARDAWWADDWLCFRRPAEDPPRTTVELRPTDPHAGPPGRQFERGRILGQPLAGMPASSCAGVDA